MKKTMMKGYTLEDKSRINEEISKSIIPVKKACSSAGISDVTYYNWKKQLILFVS
jgi:transposase-like protein